MATILIIFLRSSVRCPAIDADHPLPPECNDNQQRLEDAEFCRAVERLGQRQETNSQWEGIPVSKGPPENRNQNQVYRNHTLNLRNQLPENRNQPKSTSSVRQTH